MKKQICSIFVLVFILSCFLLTSCSDKTQSSSSDTSAQGTVLQVQDVSGSAGEQISVPIVLKNMNAIASYGNGKLAGFQLKVHVDTDAFSIVGVKTDLKDLDDNSQWTIDDTTEADGSYTIMLSDYNLVGLASSGDQTIANLYLKAADGVSGEYPVEIEIVDICDTDANSDMVGHIAVESGTITIQ